MGEEEEEEKEEEEDEGFLHSVGPLPLRLACDGVHDGVLRVQADGSVVLRMNDGGLTAGALHLNRLVGGEGGVKGGGAKGGAKIRRV